MKKITICAGVLAAAVANSPANAQGKKDTTVPFQIVETTIDDIHAAFRSGTLTARALAQGYLDRIDAYDKKGPTINSVITINPDALARGRQARCRIQELGPRLARCMAFRFWSRTRSIPPGCRRHLAPSYSRITGRPRTAFVIEK